VLEPDVTLTDFALAAECAVMAAWLHWRVRSHGPLRTWFIVFFAATSAGAMLGGIVHGFFPDMVSAIDRALWIAALLALGVVALAIWAIGAHLLLSARAARQVVLAASAVFTVYAVIVCVYEAFLVAVIYYVPATGFLLAAMVLAYLRQRRAALLAGIAGVVLSFIATVIQVVGIGFPPLGLSHNALYHLVQAVALLLLFVTALDIARAGAWDRGVTA
jgi:hypothetical protein